MDAAKKIFPKRPFSETQRLLFRTQLLLIITLSVLLATAGIVVSITTDARHRDRNLQNIAESIAHSQELADLGSTDASVLREHLDSLADVLTDLDVISVVSADGTRLYHTNHDLIGTTYDGTVPDFENRASQLYVTSDSGPSGEQRRAYAAVYSSDGRYLGFIIAIMLTDSILSETLQTLAIFAIITLAAVFLELIISFMQSKRITDALLGHEPDAFTAMYKIRDNILESLDEGILAVDGNATVQFANDAAVQMINAGGGDSATGAQLIGRPARTVPGGALLAGVLESGVKASGVHESELTDADIIMDLIPIKNGDATVGSVGILHNRTEYTKLMEDLSGTRYLVDSMRANNHDFINKLHVILGLIQMEMYDEAKSYIENITIMQRETVGKIVRAIDEPSVAALLIGKAARASELNVEFLLREDCAYSKTDLPLPAEALVTIIGNLTDNALDSMNQAGDDYTKRRRLLIGMYSRPDAVLITVEDNGSGIAETVRDHIFENGFSTKGDGRGTGLYQIKKTVEGLGGTISFESQVGAGTTFTVSFKGKGVD